MNNRCPAKPDCPQCKGTGLVPSTTAYQLCDCTFKQWQWIANEPAFPYPSRGTLQVGREINGVVRAPERCESVLPRMAEPHHVQCTREKGHAMPHWGDLFQERDAMWLDEPTDRAARSRE